jgi:hypothetical protein
MHHPPKQISTRQQGSGSPPTAHKSLGVVHNTSSSCLLLQAQASRIPQLLLVLMLLWL